MASVDIEAVSKNYGAVNVLRDISIAIPDKEFVVLVGPSGCGKSTLLRMIAGLEDITGGTIRIGGKVVNNLTPRDRDIAMVFQNYALYPHKTVAQNIGSGLVLRGVDKKIIAERTKRASAILGLDPYLDRYPRHLSGGQRQRVAMGRAIVRDPQVFLFDEPLSNLDAKLRVQMRTEIRALHQELSTTSIYVTHDQVEAMTMADRIVVLDSGRVAQVGRPLELYDNPANLFVAGFIGSPSMNFFDGVLTVEGGRASVAVAGHDLPVPPPAKGRSGQTVRLGIRPEHFRLCGEGEGIPLVIKVVEQTGADSLVFAEFAGTDLCAMFRERQTPRVGDTIRLMPLAEKVSLFDPGTGERV